MCIHVESKKNTINLSYQKELKDFMQIDRILIVGSGSIGSRHLKIAKEIFPVADIKVIHHIPNKEVDQGDALNSIQKIEIMAYRPNIAIICNPAPFHLPISQLMAEIGTHLIIEKPISISTTNIDLLIRTCKEQNLILQVGYNLRFAKSLQKFKELINDGSIGDLVRINCEAGQYLPDWRPDRDYRLGVSARKDLGGGALLELSHEIDYLRWIFGEIRWVSGTVSKESDLEIDVEDTARFKMGFEETQSGYGLVADVVLDLVRKVPSRTCTAFGSTSNLCWNGLTGAVSQFDFNKESWSQIFIEENDLSKTYEREWVSFIESIHIGKEPLVNGEDGLRVMEIIDAIRIASDSGGRVSVVYNLLLGK